MPSLHSLYLVTTAWNNVNQQKKIFYTRKWKTFYLDIISCTEEEGGGNVVFAGGWGKGVTYLAPIGSFCGIIHFWSLASGCSFFCESLETWFSRHFFLFFKLLRITSWPKMRILPWLDNLNIKSASCCGTQNSGKERVKLTRFPALWQLKFFRENPETIELVLISASDTLLTVK